MLFRHGQAVQRAVAAAQRTVLLHLAIERRGLPMQKPVVFNERVRMRKIHADGRIRVDLFINAAHGGKRAPHNDGEKYVFRRICQWILPAINQKPFQLRKGKNGENLFKCLLRMLPFGSSGQKVEPNAKPKAF